MGAKSLAILTTAEFEFVARRFHMGPIVPLNQYR
jgi:hypothetical protein